MTDSPGSSRPPSSPSIAVLPLRGTVLLPGTTLRVDIGRPRSVTLVGGLAPGDEIAVAVQRHAATADPGRADVFDVGVLARVVEVRRASGSLHRVTLEGLERVRFGDLAEGAPDEPGPAAPLRLRAERSVETRATASEATALRDTLLDELRAQDGSDIALLEALAPSLLADRVAAGLGLDFDASVSVLTELDVPSRLASVLSSWGESRSRADVRRTIDRDVRARLQRAQREAILREQLRAIQKELGGSGEGEEPPIAEAEWKRLRAKIDAGALPDEVQKAVQRELGRLRASGGQGPEAGVIRTYLEWIATLPFTEHADVKSDLGAMARQLDDDHEGLDEVKKRILEHMAVQKLAGGGPALRGRGTILCLVGPPGVGKTSLGESIARATGRPFARIALGGIRDEAEIRGHRRTYVGALPGRILHALRKVGVKNPVILLDEIDKLSMGFSGNPEAALLEVLDPEQNHTFTDHYLELPFDLSEVLFLCTANDLERLSGPLRDRLEIVELSGYTRAEKLSIARSHLVPKALASHGIEAGQLDVADEALLRIIDDYTREAGVRQLGREITRICRSVALRLARSAEDAPPLADGAAPAAELVRVGGGDIEVILGRPRFHREVAERASAPGVATGLAWTPTGGDILFIETSRMPGKGRLEITGQLGDVMRESARAALTYLRSHAAEVSFLPAGAGPDDTASALASVGDLSSEDLHIHVPQGAVPKDGPSAGVAIFTALVSLFSGRRVRSDTAMTGECTLRGRVLPVGGIKAKVLAAHRAGLSRVILPARNRRDVDDVPKDVLAAIEIVFVDDMRDALAAALEPLEGLSVEPLPGDVIDARAGGARPIGDDHLGRTGRVAGIGPISPSSTLDRSSSLP